MILLQILQKYWPYFLRGARVTVILSIVVVVLGSVLGSLIGIMKLSKNRLINAVASAYISVLRGTPLYVQLWIVFVILNKIDIPRVTFLWMKLNMVAPAMLALTLNSAAYVAEIIRAGIQAVDYGQTEAARSIGMTGAQAMRFVVMPQAVKNILPAIGNEFVTMIKETAIVRFVGVPDLMYETNTVLTSTYQALPNLIIAAIIYYMLNFVLSRGVNAFERRLQASDRH